ncbi:MAG TPA: plasmid pRiA4b ORF-3 family protein, partial [Syntrophobacteraceae bacterium]|nr:plasmid pRiA4b ORF-3 family protein [Syntrophobacteraceae bacterium]
DDIQVLPGWKTPIAAHFTEPGVAAVYEYDFGDCWLHDVLLEAILLKEQGVKYPRCIDGKRACPPEDCGGVPGYHRVLEILGNPDHDEYQETIDWVKGQTRGGRTYQPDKFNPEKVHFDNPKKRWKIAFSRR